MFDVIRDVFEDLAACGEEGGPDDEFEGDVDEVGHSLMSLIDCFVYGAKVASQGRWRKPVWRMYRQT